MVQQGPDPSLLAKGDQSRAREAQIAAESDEGAFEGKCLAEGIEAALRASPGPRDAKADFERAAIMLTDGPDRLADKWHDRASAYRPQHQWPHGGPVVHEGQRAAYALSKLFQGQGAFAWPEVPEGSRAAVRSVIDRLTDWGRGLLDQAATMREIVGERMAAWRVVQVEQVEWDKGLPTIYGHDHKTRHPVTARLADETETATHFVNQRKFPHEPSRLRIAAELATISQALACRDVRPGRTLRLVGVREVRGGEMIVRDFQPVDPQMLPHVPASSPAPEQPKPQAPRPKPEGNTRPKL